MTVRVVANCDEVELFLNEVSLGRHAIPRDAYFSDWTLPYAPGALSAVGYRAGKQAATQKLTAAGAPARLQITPLPSPVSSDVALYEITVVDEAGLNVLTATPAVTLRVEGPGRLIGLDTADLAYDGLFKTDTRDAYQGRLLAAVQRTAPAGEIRVTASAPGLAAAEKAASP
jgi:beta-galactosidase